MLRAFQVLCNEELNEFSAVTTGGPPFTAYDVGGSGDVEFTQTVATDDIAVAFIPPGYLRFIVNRRGSRSLRGFLARSEMAFWRVFRQKSILGAISVGGQTRRQLINVIATDEDNGYLGKRLRMMSRHSAPAMRCMLRSEIMGSPARVFQLHPTRQLQRPRHGFQLIRKAGIRSGLKSVIAGMYRTKESKVFTRLQRGSHLDENGDV